MVPLNSNNPYIKDTGERTTLGKVIGSGGGGSSELPEYDITDAGKVLMVDNTGFLEWGSVSSGTNQFDFARSTKNVSDITSDAMEGGNT